MKTFRKSTRGLSPIFATLILIAIAVIAGIVVYMFTSGTIGNLTGSTGTGSEKVAVQGIAGDPTLTTGMITVYAQSTGGGPVALDSVIVKDAQGATIGVVPQVDITSSYAATLPTIDSSLTTITIDYQTTALITLEEGKSYSVQLVSVAGGNFPSGSFKAAVPP